MAETINMAEIHQQSEKQNRKATVEDARAFIEGKGRLLEPSFQETFTSQILHYDSLKADIDNMSVWKKKIPFLEMGKKSNLRSSAENIKFALDVIGRYSEMFDNTESLPRVATEMAKWGAEELVAPVLMDKKRGATMGDRESVYKERRTRWFTGMEKMMRAAESWRMFLSVNGTINNEEALTRKLVGGEDEKIEFVSEMYEFMDKSKGKTFEEFTQVLDAHFVPDNLIPDERKRRLLKIKGEIRKTDGFTEDENAILKIVDKLGGASEQPIFYEYMWMIVTGDTDRYSKVFSDRLKTIGRRESKENTDSFTPKLWVGVANENDVADGVAAKVGELIKADLSDLTDENGIKPWYERKLREIGADAYFDDQNEGAIWLAMEVDLSKVLGSESGFADYIKKIGAVDKPLVTISIPVSVTEARILAKEHTSPEKMDSLRVAMIDAYTNRLAGLAMSHGFGADERVYLTPAWAQAALNAAPPRKGEHGGNLITEETIKEQKLNELLSNRLCGVVINVLGGKGSGIDTDRSELYENTAGSMERASWYQLEAMRATTLIPGDSDDRATIAYTHSMGGQTGMRLRILLPESARSKVHIIAATPVSTIDPSINTFMHGDIKNKLGNVVVQTRHSKYDAMAKLGKGLAAVGKITKIDKWIINDMIVPKDASKIGTDVKECKAMISVHGEIYEKEDAYVARQRGNLEASNFAFAQYSIDDLRLTSAVVGGSDMTVLIGEYDEVLAPKVQTRNFKEYPQVYGMHNFTGENWKQNFDGWVKRNGVPNDEGRTVFDPQTPVLIGNFAHYLNVSATGRYFLKGLLNNLLARVKTK